MQKQYALIRNTEIVDVSPFGERPGDAWLPVVNADTAPFDADNHYRLKPVYVLALDHVMRVYPVISKQMHDGLLK